MTTASRSSIVRGAINRAARRRAHRLGEGAIHALLLLSALVSVLTTLGIVVVLVFESAQFFREVSLFEFLTSTRWTPLFRPPNYGILPLVCGTMLVAAGSALVAIPLGLLAAVYLAEYAPPVVHGIFKPLLEILAGIPSVVYGYFAVAYVTPWLRSWIPSTDVFNAASASLVVGIMVLPMVVTLSEEALRAVPRSLREAAFALAATRLDATVRVVIPAAMSGIAASFLLAITRAIGETMAVTLAAGGTPALTLNPLRSVQTMSAYIVQVSQGDTPAGTPEYRTIFAVGMSLFLLTLAFNLLAQYVRGRFEGGHLA